MTHYPGGKKKIGGDIAEKIYLQTIKYEAKTGKKLKGYCEPFCGMLGVYQHIPVLFEEGLEDSINPFIPDHHTKLKYLAGDRDPTIICMWKATQKNWKPPSSCTPAKFERLKKSKNRITPEKSFLGRAAAYKNTYFSTYSENNNISIQAQHVREIGAELYDVKFSNGEYTQFSNLKNYIIYCDPPYRNTQQPYYNGEKFQNNFDQNVFDNWCIKMSKNNLVFISEYTMPKKKFKKIWSKGKENLFIVEP